MVLCFSVSTVLPLLERPLPGPGALPPDLLEGFEIPRREGDSAFLPSSWPEQGEHLLTPRLAKVGKVANQKSYWKLVAMVSKKGKSFLFQCTKWPRWSRWSGLAFCVAPGSSYSGLEKTTPTLKPHFSVIPGSECIAIREPPNILEDLLILVRYSLRSSGESGLKVSVSLLMSTLLSPSSLQK